MAPSDAALDHGAATAEAEAYAWLLSRIRQGLLAPGARLRAEEIADEIGVSRMPVREALRRLDSEGLVTLRPNRGAVVTGYGPEEILELFEMRAVLEGLAARKAAAHYGDEQIEEIGDLITRLGRVDSDDDRWIERHWALHAYVCGLSGRQRLVREVERLHLVLEPYLRSWFAALEAPVRSVDDHRFLLDPAIMRDPDAAELIMRRHVLETVPDVIDFLGSKAPARKG